MIMSQHSPFLSLLPADIVIDGILPHLSVRDLQALDTAYTSKLQRPQLRKLWKKYTYPANEMLQIPDVEWLGSVGFVVHGAVLIQPKFFFLNREKTLRFFADYLPAVKHLHLGVNCVVYDMEVANITEACPQLESLHLSYCTCMDDTVVKVLAKNCHQLHTIRIHGGLEITDEAIRELCRNCLNLRHIDIAPCLNMTDAALHAIASTFPHLQSLNIGACTFSDHAIENFASKCHELKSVNVLCGRRAHAALWRANPFLEKADLYSKELNDNDVVLLAQSCRNLQEINFWALECITDASVVAVAEHCPSLQSIDISCCNVADSSLIALGQHCHGLKVINLSKTMITDVGIAALGSGCPLLQDISAQYTNISDDGVIALANGCHDLRKISLNNCKSIGILSISTLAEKCRWISLLSLESCNVSDECLHTIARQCRFLTHLNILGRRSKSISLGALQDVLNSCRVLKCLFGCDCLSRSDYEAIRLQFPDVAW